MKKSLKIKVYFFIFFFNNFCLGHKKDENLSCEMDTDFFDELHNKFKNKIILIRAQQEILEDQERINLISYNDIEELKCIKKDVLRATTLIRESIEKDEASSLIDLAFKIKEAIEILPDVVNHKPER